MQQDVRDALRFVKEARAEAGGGNYQSLINAVLRKHIVEQLEEPIEKALRRVIREEIRRAS